MIQDTEKEKQNCPSDRFLEAVNFLYGLRLTGMKLGLDNTRRLAGLFDLPDQRTPVIHVAGTNGKGSVCAFIESVLRHNGFRTGLFTSPHLVHFNERIRINGQPVGREEIIRWTTEIAECMFKNWPDMSAESGRPTFFEAVTVMALLIFRDHSCQATILETGLGGRLDATNIITPTVSVITSIGLDHQKWLGDTLESIASEKAGIIKPGCPVVIGPAQPEVRRVLTDRAATVNAPLVEVTADEIEKLSSQFPAPLMPGLHQKTNLALALRAIEVIQSRLPTIPEKTGNGVRATRWPARLQMIALENGGRLLLDGAHNPEGILSLATYLRGAFPDRKFAMVLGFLSDRPLESMIRPLLPLAERIVFAPVHTERGADPVQLAHEVKALSDGSILIESCQAPAEAILRLSEGNHGIVVAAGSLHFAGGILKDLGISPFEDPEIWPDKMPDFNDYTPGKL